jgi:hypothetical protein
MRASAANRASPVPTPLSQLQQQQQGGTPLSLVLSGRGHSGGITPGGTVPAGTPHTVSQIDLVSSSSMGDTPPAHAAAAAAGAAGAAGVSGMEPGHSPEVIVIPDSQPSAQRSTPPSSQGVQQQQQQQPGDTHSSLPHTQPTSPEASHAAAAAAGSAAAAAPCGLIDSPFQQQQQQQTAGLALQLTLQDTPTSTPAEAGGQAAVAAQLSSVVAGSQAAPSGAAGSQAPPLLSAGMAGSQGDQQEASPPLARVLSFELPGTPFPAAAGTHAPAAAAAAGETWVTPECDATHPSAEQTAAAAAGAQAAAAAEQGPGTSAGQLVSPVSPLVTGSIDATTSSGGASRIILRPRFLPPDPLSADSSMLALGGMPQLHREPFYGNPADKPPQPAVFAGREFRCARAVHDISLPAHWQMVIGWLREAGCER